MTEHLHRSSLHKTLIEQTQIQTYRKEVIIQTEDIIQTSIGILFYTQDQGHTKTRKKIQTDIQIINLSQRQLNKTEIKLLEKGLKFTPAPRTSNIQELTKDVSEFTRKVRLIEYFDDKEDDDESLVKNKSNFVSPRGREQLLDNFVLSTINIPLEPIEKANVKRNISKSEQTAVER